MSTKVYIPGLFTNDINNDIKKALATAKANNDTQGFNKLLKLKKQAAIMNKNFEELEYLFTYLQVMSKFEQNFNSYVYYYIKNYQTISGPITMSPDLSKKMLEGFKLLKANAHSHDKLDNRLNILFLSILSLVGSGLLASGIYMIVGAALGGPIGIAFVGAFIALLTITALAITSISLLVQYRRANDKQLKEIAAVVIDCIDDVTKQELSNSADADDVLMITASQEFSFA